MASDDEPRGDRAQRPGAAAPAATSAAPPSDGDADRLPGPERLGGLEQRHPAQPADDQQREQHRAARGDARGSAPPARARRRGRPRGRRGAAARRLRGTRRRGAGRPGGGAVTVIQAPPATAAITAPLPARPPTKPWQPATCSTGRRPAIAPGIDEQAARPASGRARAAARSTTRAATYTTRPRRFWAEASAGPVCSSISARRTCACGQPSRSGSTTVARRSPGSSSAQPRRRAKCTAERGGGADRRVERLGRGGRARVEHDERARVGLRDQLALHQPRAARHARPVDAGGGRALDVLAQAVDLRLGGGDQRGAGVAGGDLAAVRRRPHRLDPRQHEHLVHLGAGHDALGEAEGVAQHEHGRGERPPPAAPERHLHAHARATRDPPSAARARAAAARPPSPAAARSRPAFTSTSTSSGSSSSTLRRDTRRSIVAPQPPRPIHARRARAQQHERGAGDVERLGVERAGHEQQEDAEGGAAEGRAHRGAPTERRGGGDRVGHDPPPGRRRPPRARA